MKKQIGAMDFSNIEKAIITVKEQKVIIDNDVADIYGVLTKEVNQAIKNNPDKFPAGYILKLTDEETNAYSCQFSPVVLVTFGRKAAS